MNIAIWGFIGTILGVIIGSSTSILTTLINNKNAIKLQFKAEKLKQVEQFREFQFKTFINLQSHIVTTMRHVTNVHFENIESFKKHGKLSYLSVKLDEDLREAFQELSILIERVNSNELRGKLKNLHSEMGNCILPENKTNADETFQNCAILFKSISPEIGKELRSTYNHKY